MNKKYSKNNKLNRSSPDFLQQLGFDWRALAKNIPDYLLILDQKGKILFINKVIQGLKLKDVIGSSVYDYLPKNDHQMLKKLLQQTFEQGKSQTYENKALGPKNRWDWYSTRVGPLKAKGKIIAAILISNIITEKKLIEQALQASELKNRVLTEASPDMIFRLGKDGTYLDYYASKNTALKPIVSPKEFLGKKMSEILPASIVKPAMRHVREAIKTNTIQTYEYSLPYENGDMDFEARIVRLSSSEVFIFIRDITELKQLQKQILEISERVQRNIGSDLHDNLSQRLTGIAFLSKALEQKLSAKHLEEQKDVATIVKLVNESIDQTRSLYRGLHPTDIESDGLHSALQELALHIEHIYNISCSFKSPKPVPHMPIEKAIHLFRITQEAVNNAVKHSDCKNIIIEFKPGKQNSTLSVTDDGKGIKKTKKKITGIGLNIMKYRAKMIGAALEFSTPKSGGTKVTCAF